MKKLILFVAVLALGLSSCSKDDDKAPEAELVGKWEFSQEGAIINGQEVLEPYVHEVDCAKDFLLFAASTVTEYNYYGADCEEEIYVDAYNRNGNTLNIMMDGELFVVEIVSLSNTTLKLKISETFDGTTEQFVTVFTKA